MSTLSPQRASASVEEALAAISAPVTSRQHVEPGQQLKHVSACQLLAAAVTTSPASAAIAATIDLTSLPAPRQEDTDGVDFF